MTLPRKPKGVLDVKEEGDLRKERDTLGKPSTLGGMTLDKVPGGKYELVTKEREVTKHSEKIEWYKPAMKEKGKIIPEVISKQNFRGREGSESGFRSRKIKVPYKAKEKYQEWEWKDPQKGTREKLHKMETNRINRIGAIDKRLGEPVWGRTRKKKITNRPGTRSGKTILTGGLGIPDEDKPLLMSGGSSN